jgi:hypothetical protein
MMLAAILRAAGPETLTTPMPPRPDGVAGATMVSPGSWSSGIGQDPVTASRGGALVLCILRSVLLRDWRAPDRWAAGYRV